MSWKVHGTDEVFAGLRGLCSNVYRMYDPCDHRYYYDHECDAYECAVEDAAQEYERLLKHCEKQREELAAIKNPLGRLKGAFMDNIDGGTEVERIEGSSKVRAGSSITDELREIAVKTECASGRCEKLYRGDLEHAADRIDEGIEREYVKLPVDADGVPIRAGDVMEERSGHTFEVASLMAFGGSDNWLVLSDARNFSSFREPHDLRHVQPDSWERIIHDATAYRTYDKAPCSISELVERCRRLAGERG